MASKNMTGWSEARFKLKDQLENGHLRYGDAVMYVNSLTDAEVAVVSKAITDGVYFQTALDQYRKDELIDQVEAGFVSGADGLAEAAKAVVEANRQSI